MEAARGDRPATKLKFVRARATLETDALIAHVTPGSFRSGLHLGRIGRNDKARRGLPLDHQQVLAHEVRAHGCAVDDKNILLPGFHRESTLARERTCAPLPGRTVQGMLSLFCG